MIKAIIFDLDGVICSTDKFHAAAWKHLAGSLGVRLTEEDLNSLRGVGRMESLEYILEKGNLKYSDGEKRSLAEKKNDEYKELLKQMSPEDVSPDVKCTLKTFRNSGIKMAIGSSSKNTKYILKQIGLEDFFDAVSDGTNISRSKPDPEVFLKAAESIDEQPSNCLVVEDAVSGIEAAYHGGFLSAAIKTAQADSHADYKIDKLSELIRIVSYNNSERITTTKMRCK